MSESEVRLVPLSGEDVERLRRLSPSSPTGVPMSPRESATLDSIVTAYESGITKDEAQAAADSINTRERDRVDIDQLADQARSKLRTAFPPSETHQERS